MVLRMLSPPGTSPNPSRPAESVTITIFRVKNGPWAPDRFNSIESYPATGNTSMRRIVGLVGIIIARLPSLSCHLQDAPNSMGYRIAPVAVIIAGAYFDRPQDVETCRLPAYQRMSCANLNLQGMGLRGPWHGLLRLRLASRLPTAALLFVLRLAIM